MTEEEKKFFVFLGDATDPLISFSKGREWIAYLDRHIGPTAKVVLYKGKDDHGHIITWLRISNPSDFHVGGIN